MPAWTWTGCYFHDSTTGEVIPIENRIGLLDRKLRVVNENTLDENEWLIWVFRAFQSVYGYEFQGDNLLIARINLLTTFCDYLKARLNRDATKSEITKIINIICWNFWQMDGLQKVVPFGKPREEYPQLTLWDYDSEEGSIYFGGEHDKLREVSDMMWELLVIDEAHEGVDTTKTDIAFNQIKGRILCCSGLLVVKPFI